MSSRADRIETRAVMGGREKIVNLTVRYVALLVALIFALFPVVWIVSAAFNPSGNLASQSLIPAGVDSLEKLFSNFRGVLQEDLNIHPYWNWLGNSLIVASVSAVLSVLVGMLAAYAFSRFRFRGRQNLLVLVLLIQVFPNMLAMVALFLILQQVGKLAEYIPQALPFLSGINWGAFQLFGLDSLGGLILVYLGGAMGINTWLMKGFFDTVPRDLDESAMLDGASAWQTFTAIILPLVRPVLAVIFMLSFIGTYGDYMLAKVMLTNTQKYTVAVGLNVFIGEQFGQKWGQFAAGAVMAAIPTMILFYVSQSQLQGGLTSGAVKG